VKTYHIIAALLITVYFAAEYFALLAVAFSLLIGVGIWLLTKLIPPDQITENWK